MPGLRKAENDHAVMTTQTERHIALAARTEQPLPLPPQEKM